MSVIPLRCAAARGVARGYYWAMAADPTHLEPALGLPALAAALVDRDWDGLVIKNAASGVWLQVNATMSAIFKATEVAARVI